MLNVKKPIDSSNSVLSCPELIKFISLKNRKQHKKELLQYLEQENTSSYTETEAYIQSLERELRCFVPLSAYNLKTLCQQGSILLHRWQGWTGPKHHMTHPTVPGIWVQASQLPMHAYLDTGNQLDGFLPELTRVQEAGWHLACYQYALRCADQWYIKGPAGVLKLSERTSDQTLVLPRNSYNFFTHWLKKHQVAQVETLP